MIIEMHLNLTKDKTLLATWEFSDSMWLIKSNLLLNFISEIMESQKIPFNETKWNNNIIFTLETKPYKFYELQDCFNDYFKSIGATILVE